MTYIIIEGNPVDGLQFFGPFPSAEAAQEWAERELADQEYWGARLEQP